MKKRTVLLALAMSLLLTLPVEAAKTGTDHFVRSKTYSGQFSDLPAGSAFYGNVSALYEYGLSVGKPDGTFGLKDSLTVGQAVIFAGRIRSLFATGDAEKGPAAHRAEGQLTAEPYLLYLQKEGVLDSTLDDRLTAVATRAEMAHILAIILPQTALPPVHDALVTTAYATRRFVADVTEYTPYQADILKLYRCGISVGSDGSGAFLPEAPITRGAAAAMLTRIIDPALRVTPAWNLLGNHSAAGATMASLVPPCAPVTAPANDAELDQAVQHMLSSGSNVMNLQYESISSEAVQDLMYRALVRVKSYCEQSYNYVSCTFSHPGTVVLTFSSTGFGEQIAHYRQAAAESAVAVHDDLWRSGQITESSTDREKAWAYYKWVCDRGTYDFKANRDSLSHLAYSLFENGLVVCDGYTGAYNLLLKLEGIDCTALMVGDHMWTEAVLDGEVLHIDPTWGDAYDTLNEDYFAMTPARSRYLHSGLYQ